MKYVFRLDSKGQHGGDKPDWYSLATSYIHSDIWQSKNSTEQINGIALAPYWPGGKEEQSKNGQI